MEYILKTKRKQLTLTVTVLTGSPQTIHVVTMDKNKEKTVYTNRSGVVNGKRSFEIQLPESPDELKIVVYNEKNGWKDTPKFKASNDKTFKVAKFGIDPLKKWNILIEPDKKDFLDLAQMISENAGILHAYDIDDPEKKPYTSKSGKFKILYLKTIKNKDGKVLTTPARISNKTAIIEVSQQFFSQYSVQMRMMILLHEFAHYYLNKDMRNEMQADLNGLYFYLGSGYSPVEAHTAFLKVFDTADTAQNEMRYQMIKKYIYDFMSGKIAAPTGNTTVLRQAA